MAGADELAGCCIPGHNAAQVGADGIDAVAADRLIAGDDQVGGVALEPLHQAAITLRMCAQPAAGTNRVAQFIARQNPTCARLGFGRSEKAGHGIERADGHTAHGSEGEQVEQLTAREIRSITRPGGTERADIGHGRSSYNDFVI